MIDSSSTALVMIDMQNGFINETSPLCVAGAKKSISACKRVLEYARQNAVPVYHIVRRYAADGSDVEPCRYDTWKDERPLSNVCPEEIGPSEPAELAPLEGEAVIVKPRFSAFFQTDLHARLQKQGIDTLLLTGTTTPKYRQYAGCGRRGTLTIIRNSAFSLSPKKTKRSRHKPNKACRRAL